MEWGGVGQMETAGWHMDAVCRKLVEGGARREEGREGGEGKGEERGRGGGEGHQQWGGKRYNK